MGQVKEKGAEAGLGTDRRLRVARLSLVSNFLLAALKLGVGLTTSSIAILSDGVNSACDLFATGLAYFAVAKSGQPPDLSHPWGYGKYESIAGMVEAVAIFAAGAYVVVEAIRDIEHPHIQPASLLGIAVMVVSLVLNFLLSRRVFQIAVETESVALRAEGEHIWTDVITSAGVIVALVLARTLRIPHIQAAAALLVSALIFRAAYSVSLMAMAPLLDRALPPDETQAIQKQLQADPLVKGWHRLRTRRSGALRLIDVHVLLPDELTFVEAHRHAEALEEAIGRALPGQSNVTIHAEPYLDESQHQEEFHLSEPPAPVS